MFRATDLATCRRCGEQVRWTLTHQRKRLAVNPDPDPAGNTAVMRDAAGDLRSRRVTAESRIQPFERLMMPHVATCTPKTRKPRPPQPCTGEARPYYDVLGVHRQATPAQIRTAYRRLARTLHPDLNPHAGDRFKQVTEAYDVLSNPTARQVYDLTGRRPR